MSFQLQEMYKSEFNNYSDSVKSKIRELSCSSIPVVLHAQESDTYTGLMPLFATLSIAHDFKGAFFSERYCFSDPERAISEFISWYKRGFNEQRPTGWIACRNVSPDDIRDSMEKFHSKEYAQAALLAYNRLCDKSSGYVTTEMIIDEMDNSHDSKHQIAYLKLTGQISQG